MSRITALVALLAPAVLTGCWDPAWPVPGSGPQEDRDGGVPTGNFTFYQDILPIIQSECAQCHGNPPQFAATMPLMDYQDVMVLGPSGRPVHEEMAERVIGGRDIMPPPSQGTLSDEQINAIRAWSLQGAPIGTPVAQYTWHQDIEPVIREACHLCHGSPPQFSAPMSLVTYEDMTATNAANTPFYEVAAFRIQAPSGRMPPPTHSRQLTADEIAMITAWAEAGAPEGEPVPIRDGGVRDGGTPDSGPGTPWRGGPGSPEIANPDLRWFDTFAHAQGSTTTPFRVPEGETIYECWSFFVDTEAPVEYITWFEPILDTTSNTHHLMVYIDDSFGDPSPEPFGPFECEGFPREAAGGEFTEYIDGWFPGRGLTPFPDGIGMEVRTGYRIVLQGHYDRIGPDTMLDDMSGIRLIFDRRTHIPTATLWTGVLWQTPLRGVDSREGDCIIRQATTIYQGFPHMHTYGTRILTQLSRQGGPFETIMEIPAWNFDDQPILPVPEQYQQLNPGDVLRTRCEWDTGNQEVFQGDASGDEMCFNTFFAYPPIPNVGLGGECIVTQN